MIEAALRDGRLPLGLSALLGWFPEAWGMQLEQFCGSRTPLRFAVLPSRGRHPARSW